MLWSLIILYLVIKRYWFKTTSFHWSVHLELEPWILEKNSAKIQNVIKNGWIQEAYISWFSNLYFKKKQQNCTAAVFI